jgi:hypothetical protein
MPTFRDTRSVLALLIVVAGLSFLVAGAFVLGAEFALLAGGAIIAIVSQVVERYFGSNDAS